MPDSASSARTSVLPPVVVLCGGRGTRLAGFVSDRPKVLADVAGRPFLAHLLARLAAQGARCVILAAGFRADQVEAFVADRSPDGLDVTVVTEPGPLGTGGALAFALAAAGLAGPGLAEPVLALNGDTFFSGALATLAALRGDAPVALAVVRVPDAGRYGAVRFDGDATADAAPGRVTAFEEKGADGPGWINAGAYALAPGALAGVAPGTAASFERDVLPGLVGRAVAVPFPAAAFLDIGTPDDYARAARFLADRPTDA
jgi:D-glycero-alpha-D-manno-heptose 1-phosphate guanylyltransferase